jgi:WD40 repeat protein
MINIKIIITSLLVLFSTYSLFGQKPTEDDPIEMWNYGSGFSTYPAIHPNGNVLIGEENIGDIIEINGQTGQLVRRIPLPAPTSSLILSKDGSRMAASGYIINTETGAVIKAHPRAAAVRFLHPSNSKIIYTLFNQKDTSWIVWDMENDTYKNYQIPYLVTTIDVSSDGRFLAVASKETSLPINDQRTHFYLYDAQTMKLIKELEDVVAAGRTIEFIQFSENAKYVGYGHLTGGKPKSTFFTCMPPYKRWEINKMNQPPYGMNSIGFIKDEYVFMSTGGITENFSIIWDINNDKEILRTNKYFSYNPIFNKIYNSILVYVGGLGFVSLDFNKILNSVSVEEQADSKTKFQTEYRKGILSIKNYETTAITTNISINDLQGKVVFSQQILSPNSQIEIPLDLINGVYILQIQDWNHIFSQKFFVLE